jgi:arginine/lysine/ornithine decarboxylase
MLPRAAFAAKETIPASQAAGRIAAEQITPYPPGIPRDHPQ